MIPAVAAPPVSSPEPATFPELLGALDQLQAASPPESSDLAPLQRLLGRGGLSHADATEGLLRVILWSREPSFRNPALPALLLRNGADPNALIPFAPGSTQTCLQAAVYYGLVTEETAPDWERAGARWDDGRLLSRVFEFRPLSESNQARSLLALAPYVPKISWGQRLASGCTARQEWERLAAAWGLDSEVRARMVTSRGAAGQAKMTEVELARTLPSTAAANRLRNRF